MDCTPGRKKVAVVERYLIRVNVWTVRRAEKSGSCREVFNKSQCMDCTPDQKKVAVVERWPLLEVQLYLTEIFLAFVKEHLQKHRNKEM